MNVPQWMDQTRALVDQWIGEDMGQEAEPGTVEAVMRYSLLAGGKRLRPLLVLASAAYLGRPPEDFREVALAVEYIHTYSLIHDDLPAMDNDDLRRGRPTAHKVFGEAMAILAGDALLTEAFVKLGTIPASRFEPGRVQDAVKVLATAAGRLGLVRGQVNDLAAEHQPLALDELEAIHRLKTGALFVAALRMPAVLIGAAAADARLGRFGDHFGLAFQIVDDILNVVGDVKVLGKATGTDRTLGKATYPGLLGITEAGRRARVHQQHALEALGDNADGTVLKALLDFAVNRQW